MASEYLDDCCRRKLVFITGKGGVGKTSLAWAAALACARRGKRTAVASWNPLGDASSAPVTGDWNVDWVPLETVATFREYVLRTVYFEKLFDAVFDNRVFRTFVLATPGLSDTVMAGKLWDRVHRAEQDILFVDLPATGHAVSFFRSPIGVREVFGMGIVRRETDKIHQLFESAQTRIDLVATPQELPMTECIELHRSLETLYPERTRYLMLNRCLPEFDLPERADWDPESRALLERYAEDRTEQKEITEMSARVPLARVDISNFPSQSFRDCVENIARQLEQA